MITVITGQSGNGKTSLAIMMIKAAVETGRPVITVGIPKLKLPCIEWRRSQLKKWHEVVLPEGITMEQFAADGGEVYDDEGNLIPCPLKSVPDGALIVVDEAQKNWPASGSKFTDDTLALSMHRHWGLDFIIMSQSPRFLHMSIAENTSIHKHIQKTWKGRQLLEFGELMGDPTSKTNQDIAYKKRYKPNPDSFKLYESATEHTNLKYGIPRAALFYGFIFCVALPYGLYSFYNMMDKRIHPENYRADKAQAKPKKENIFTASSDLPGQASDIKAVNSDWQIIGFYKLGAYYNVILENPTGSKREIKNVINYRFEGSDIYITTSEGVFSSVRQFKRFKHENKPAPALPVPSGMVTS